MGYLNAGDVLILDDVEGGAIVLNRQHQGRRTLPHFPHHASCISAWFGAPGWVTPHRARTLSARCWTADEADGGAISALAQARIVVASTTPLAPPLTTAESLRLRPTRP